MTPIPRRAGSRYLAQYVCAVFLLLPAPEPGFLWESCEVVVGSDSLFSETRPAMGTDFGVYLYAESTDVASALFEAAFTEIARVEELLSTYRPSSELSRINREAIHEGVVTDGEMARILGIILDWSDRTNGAFDPSVGALLDVWGFRSQRTDMPTEPEIREALTRVGSHHIRFSASERTITIDTDGIWMDSGAFGKGYALDRVASLMKDHGIESALLVSGQSTYVAIGSPPDSNGWQVFVPDPEHEESHVSTVYLVDQALSTSGATRRHIVYDEKKYAHILDPRSGMPVEHTIRATVKANSGMEADILSTAAFVLGPDEARSLIGEIDGVSALIISGPSNHRETTKVRWARQ